MELGRSCALTIPGGVENVKVMKLAVTTEIDLEGPPTTGYVTWLNVEVTGDGRSCEAPLPHEPSRVRRARVAIVHVGELVDAEGEVRSALRGTRIEAIYEEYFNQGWYKDEYADGAGIDLFFFDELTFDEHALQKNLDLALVRRLCDTLGSGCQLAVVPYRDAENSSRWAKLGFVVSTPGRTHGLMHLKLGQHQTRLIDTSGRGDYEVVSESLLPLSRPLVRSFAN